MRNPTAVRRRRLSPTAPHEQETVARTVTRGQSRAMRVALARRLAEIVYHMWKDECDYFAVLRRGVARELGRGCGLRTEILIGQSPSARRGRSGTDIMGQTTRLSRCRSRREFTPF